MSSRLTHTSRYLSFFTAHLMLVQSLLLGFSMTLSAGNVTRYNDSVGASTDQELSFKGQDADYFHLFFELIEEDLQELEEKGGDEYHKASAEESSKYQILPQAWAASLVNIHKELYNDESAANSNSLMQQSRYLLFHSLKLDC